MSAFEEAFLTENDKPQYVKFWKEMQNAKVPERDQLRKAHALWMCLLFRLYWNAQAVRFVEKPLIWITVLTYFVCKVVDVFFLSLCCKGFRVTFTEYDT